MPEPARATSVDKALELCESLSRRPGGATLAELSRGVGQPAPTVHRLLRLLKRRGYVRQDDETGRYALTLKMLDLSFRWLGRSEVRLHAWPVVREHVVGAGRRAFVAVPASGEVTYVWSSGGGEAAMHTDYGREMPSHCALYFEQGTVPRRLSCLRLARASDLERGAGALCRLGPGGDTTGPQRMNCTCAPVFDYTGREVARVGLFEHARDDGRLCVEDHRRAWDLARRTSLRLGHLPAAGADPA
jgi:hypothetical protein